MKVLKIFTILFFMASAAVFGGYKYHYEQGGDTTVPVITVPAEPLECSIAVTEEELLSGITVWDEQDGDLTEQLFVESLSTFVAENTRTLNVAVVDAAGNAAKAARTIVYTDYSAPRFSISEPLVFYSATERIAENIHAEDVIDGDLSAKVKAASSYHMKSEPGTYPMEFMVSNSVGDISRFTATVTLIDYSTYTSSPVLTLSEYLVYVPKGSKVNSWSYLETLTFNRHQYVKQGSYLVPDEQSAYGWEDYPETIEQSDLTIVDNVDYNKEGCYEIVYRYNYEEQIGEVRLVVIVE